MSEESRLGRETIETAYALKQLVTAGVRVFFYLEDRERTLDFRCRHRLISQGVPNDTLLENPSHLHCGVGRRSYRLEREGGTAGARTQRSFTARVARPKHSVYPQSCAVPR
jgi:hypothetical protein